jgi:prevent-host-death family protein
MRLENISEAKAHFSALVNDVMNGQEIVIKKGGRPVVKMVPFEAREIRRTPGALRGKIKISKDFDQLSPEILQLFGFNKNGK